MSDGIVDRTKDIARDANDHPLVRLTARLGYAASGLVHLLIAWAALGIAWTPLRHGTADQSGALGGLAKQPWGTALLWVLVAGFVGLAAWQLTEAIGGRHKVGSAGVFDRLKALGKMVTYLALGWTAMTFARGGASDSRTQSTEVTQALLEVPAGRLLVAALGLATIGIAVYHVVKGVKQSFLRDLADDPGDLAEYAGWFGYVAKGVALGVVGASSWQRRPRPTPPIPRALMAPCAPWQKRPTAPGC